MKEVFVTGASGLVGSRFTELYSKKYNFTTPVYPEFDLTNSKNVKEIVNNNPPDVLINFAAFTDVTGAESQRDNKNNSCWQVNVEGVANLLESISSNVHFIQISTDMVFPGSKEDPGPYAEDHTPETDSEKLTWYGYTKAQAEQLLKNRKNSTILRIIYPVRKSFDQKSDYLRRPLALFDEGKLYPMFSDQQVSFAYIDEICLALEKIIDKNLDGIFHASSSDTATPYEIITYLIKVARGVDNGVKTSSLDEFLKTVDNPVRYPKYGGLNVEETEKRLGINFSSYKHIIDTIYKPNK